MNDQEELLITSYLDGTLEEANFERLQALLRSDAEARSTLRTLATIDSKLSDLAIEPIASVLSSPRPQLAHKDLAAGVKLSRRATVVMALVGALLLLLGVQIGGHRDHRRPQLSATPVALPVEATHAGVAVLVSAIGIQSPSNHLWHAGDILTPGHFEMQTGLAEIEFYSGARLIMTGATSLQIVSARHAICNFGKLRGQVPPQAIGFTISSPRFELVDLGTEFGLEVEPGGDSQVQVFDGEVELYPTGSPRSPHQVKRLLGGGGLSWTASGEPTRIESRPDSFLSFEQVRQQSKTQSRERYAAWQLWNERLASDERIAIRYDFEQQGELLIDTTSSAAHGTIVGCEWSSGRWAEKGALEFKRPGDRVRVDIPGEYDNLTLTAWIRVDANPGRHQGLLLTDGFAAGHPHWQIAPAGDLRMGIGNPVAESGFRGTTYSSANILSPQRIGVWSFVATVYDRAAGTISHFHNGQRLSQARLKHLQKVTIGLADIGNWGIPLPHHPQQVRNFVGKMDELTIWRTALDGAEIRRIYQAHCP